MLLWTIYVLAGAIGLMLLGVFVREAWRARERIRFGRLRTVCTEQLQTLKTLESEELATRLKESFPLPVIEKCLEDLAEQAVTPLRQKLVQVNEDLGIVQARIEALRDGGSWPERAAAAERLGTIGHSAAVLPLIAVREGLNERLDDTGPGNLQ